MFPFCCMWHPSILHEVQFCFAHIRSTFNFLISVVKIKKFLKSILEQHRVISKNGTTTIAGLSKIGAGKTTPHFPIIFGKCRTNITKINYWNGRYYEEFPPIKKSSKLSLCISKRSLRLKKKLYSKKLLQIPSFKQVVSKYHHSNKFTNTVIQASSLQIPWLKQVVLK